MDDITIIFGLIILALLVLVLLKLYGKKEEPEKEEIGFIKAQLGELSRQINVVQDVKTKIELSSDQQKDLQKHVEDTKTILNRFSADYQARLEEEKSMRNAIKSIEGLLVGSRSKGQAGENIVAEALSVFPQDMIERNFRVNNNPVEFALRLPNSKVLPIDSKFGRTDLIEELQKVEDNDRREEIINELSRAVASKVKEATKYIDPSITENHCIAAVPDPVFSASSSIYYDAYRNGVILMSYSMTVPYLLTYLRLREQYSQNIDLENLASCLTYASKIIEELNEMLEGYMADALKRITKSYEEIKRHVSNLNTTLMRIKTEYKE